MRRDPRVAILARDLVWADESGGSLAFSYAARKLEASLRSAPDLAGVEVRVIDLRTGDEEAFFEGDPRLPPHARGRLRLRVVGAHVLPPRRDGGEVGSHRGLRPGRAGRAPPRCSGSRPTRRSRGTSTPS
ncbi:MAG: hypothetical protein M5U28_10150 [Sandaracinaceae bacterium]|nr:hypothetical protein [Sandaracinaceae bacterium]